MIVGMTLWTLIGALLAVGLLVGAGSRLLRRDRSLGVVAVLTWGGLCFVFALSHMVFAPA
jgi:hypothetical protein